MFKKSLFTLLVFSFVIFFFLPTNAKAEENIYNEQLDYYFTAPHNWEGVAPSTLRGLQRDKPTLQARLKLPNNSTTFMEVYHEKIESPELLRLFSKENPLTKAELTSVEAKIIEKIEKKYSNEYFGVSFQKFQILPDKERISMVFNGASKNGLNNFAQELIIYKDTLITFHISYPFIYTYEENASTVDIISIGDSFKPGETPEMIQAKIAKKERLEREKMEQERLEEEAKILAAKELKEEKEKQKQAKKEKSTDTTDYKSLSISILISVIIVTCAVIVYRKKFFI